MRSAQNRLLDRLYACKPVYKSIVDEYIPHNDSVVIRRHFIEPIDTEDMTMEELDNLADYKAQMEEDNYRDREN